MPSNRKSLRRFVSMVNERRDKRAPNQKRFKWDPFWSSSTAIALVALLVSGGSLYYAHLSRGIAAKQAATAEKAEAVGRSVNRAYVHFGNAHFQRDDSGSEPVIGISIELTNAGNTPALSGFVYLECPTRRSSLKEHFLPLNMEATSFDLGPKQTIRLLVCILPVSELVRINEQKIQRFILGEMWYADVFERVPSLEALRPFREAVARRSGIKEAIEMIGGPKKLSALMTAGYHTTRVSRQILVDQAGGLGVRNVGPDNCSDEACPPRIIEKPVK